MAFHYALHPSSYPTILSHPCFGPISDTTGMENLIQSTVSPCAPRSGGASPEGQTALGGRTEWERDETSSPMHAAVCLGLPGGSEGAGGTGRMGRARNRISSMAFRCLLRSGGASLEVRRHQRDWWSGRGTTPDK